MVSIGMLHLFPIEFPKLMAKNFVNLTQIQSAHLRDIEPLICASVKLKEIKIWKFLVDKPDELRFCDFLTLNEKRKQLAQAQKITIFIDEEHFLKLKFMAKINLSLIEVKRIESNAVDDLTNWLEE